MAWVAHGAHPVRRPVGSLFACGEFGAAGGAKGKSNDNGDSESSFADAPCVACSLDTLSV
jgi:hypothetical protein